MPAVPLGFSLLVPTLKILAILVPVAYLIFERRLRHRPLTGSGFRLRAFPADLLRSLGWVLLVGIGTQALAVYGSHFFLPEFSAHVLARLPFDANLLDNKLITGLLVATLGEEVIFRGLFQDRLSVFLPVSAAVGITSLVFALMHYSAGPTPVVVADLGFVFIDSLIYGIIFARSKNLWVCWAAHFLADVVGMAFLLTLI